MHLLFTCPVLSFFFFLVLGCYMLLYHYFAVVKDDNTFMIKSTGHGGG